MVTCVLDERWTIEATADRFQVDAKTVRKWRDRYLAEGVAGLFDRSSRPHRSPNGTRPRTVQRVVHLRRKHRWGADHIAHETGLAAEATGTTRLRRRMVERVLTSCARMPASEVEPLMTLLRRYATEAAREEARLFCDELADMGNVVAANDAERSVAAA